MKKQPVYFLVLLAVAAISFTSCKNNADYKKAKSGLMYKIFSDGKDSVVKPGNILKIDFSVKVGATDSVLRTSVGKMPVFVPIQADAPNEEYSPTEVFGQLRKGDSVVIVQMIDTLLKRNPNSQLPPYLKRGGKLLTIVKVLDVFKSPEMATNDKNAEEVKERARQAKEVETDLIKGNADMAAWLGSKSIVAVKTGKGTYVVVKDPGAGMQADSGKFVTVRYEGRMLADGKIFESTMNPQAQPFTFKIGAVAGGAIPGWDEGLRLFKKGGKGTLYIPGALCYGKNPPPNSPFKPNEALIFDNDVVDVTDKDPTPPQQQMQMTPEMREQIQKMQQQQQQKPGH